MSKALAVLKVEKADLERQLKKITKAIEVLEDSHVPRTRVYVAPSEQKKRVETMLDLITKEPGLTAQQISIMLGHSSEGFTYKLLRELTSSKVVHFKIKSNKRRYYLGVVATENDMEAGYEGSE